MLTQQRLKELLHYCPETGVFTWLVNRRGGKAFAGNVAGMPKRNKSGKEYWYVAINQTWYLAHRLVFLYQTGTFPASQVDHIDGNGINNRLVNLRLVTNKENAKNVRKAKNNTSGTTGVHWSNKDQRWVASIKIDRKPRYLGSFRSLGEAILVRKAAEEHLGFHPNHGSDRPL